MKNQLYEKTLAYYNNFTDDYVQRTATTDEVQPFYDAITPLLTPGAKILDFGCGTGRDSLFFKNAGFDVTSYDGSSAMCEISRNNGLKNVFNKTFLELDSKNEFDLVWAHSSLLHAPSSDLPHILDLVYNSLRTGGKVFTTFKYGDFEGIRNDRLFNDFTEAKFDELLKKSGKFDPYKIWVTDDVRTKQNRNNQWLNVILSKRNMEK